MRGIYSWAANEGEAIRGSSEAGRKHIIDEIASALLELPSKGIDVIKHPSAKQRELN